MTDRAKGCWVAFNHDIRVDDVEVLVSAIRMIRGVADVQLEITDHADFMARAHVREQLAEKILQLYKEIVK